MTKGITLLAARQDLTKRLTDKIYGKMPEKRLHPLFSPRASYKLV